MILMSPFQLSASCSSVTRTRQLRHAVGLGDSRDRRWSLITDPGLAISSTWGGRTRTSSIFEQEIVCAPSLCTFTVMVGLVSSGIMGIQPNCVELDIKFLLTPVVSRQIKCVLFCSVFIQMIECFKILFQSKGPEASGLISVSVLRGILRISDWVFSSDKTLSPLPLVKKFSIYY